MEGAVHNLYLDALERLGHTSPTDDLAAYQDEEQRLQRLYAYAAPTPAALRLAARYAPLLEIGAGSGYWAWLLRQMGVDIVAYDAEPPDGTYRNSYFAGNHAWTHVREGGVEAIREHADRTLFLCWPPPATPMAEDCLAAFRGDVVLYAGEWRGACGTLAFFDALEASFTLVEAVELPSSAVQDALRVFRRRGR